MDRNYAYNLYHRTKDFCQILSANGFKLRQNDDIRITTVYESKNSNVEVGTIFDNRMLVIYTEWIEKYPENKPFNRAASKLQKLADEFEIKD